ncbi:molecular chaperone DnaJ [Pseudoalteromonas lipolytica]|jgi:hypothetical protein|uniref:Molecular chaperone DnaJ n=1 Tax=Pseudoalteromonas lipolytica TaxID=570156 RepID=A0AAD0S0E0_9GAMM|nr:MULTISPECIES: DNA-J related domain-containing protein [Pseudoalteromonas]AXV63926.1 molecular chaperone DnaJ [Pseudoalteromonas donghaensis]MCC9663150.1 DnaJ domain-containing protein [Pseudoalteromonas sp. MB41]QLJ08419.1 DnaJ domain-containing protein [Pseudoalteromonas sp. JSTW]
MVNPLIDEIFYLLLRQSTWKVHTLASALGETNYLKQLDEDPQKNLFKRNFLIMNGLYQLQAQLAPTQRLEIASLHIELIDTCPTDRPEKDDPLRAYYLDWQNYDTSRDAIDALLDQFWQRFSTHNRFCLTQVSAEQLYPIIQHWQLPADYSYRELQKRWRQLALKYHPDRQGSATKFKKIRQEYEQLKANCSH